MTAHRGSRVCSSTSLDTSHLSSSGLLPPQVAALALAGAAAAVAIATITAATAATTAAAAGAAAAAGGSSAGSHLAALLAAVPAWQTGVAAALAVVMLVAHQLLEGLKQRFIFVDYVHAAIP